MENKIINEIKRVGAILFISISFLSLFSSILILVNIEKAHTQNEKIIELLQQDKLEK